MIPSFLPYLPLLTLRQIHHLEDEINTIVTVLQYSIPLLGALIVAAGSMFYYVRKTLAANGSKLDAVVQQTNGALQRVADQVSAVHDATVGSVPAPSGTLQQEVQEVHDATVTGKDDTGGSPPTGPATTK